MNSELIIAFFLALHLRRSFKTASLLPGWNKIFLGIMYAAIALQVLEMAMHFAKPVTMILGHLLVLSVIWIIYSQQAFRSARAIMFAVLPFIVLTFLNDIFQLINSDFFKPWVQYYEAARFFAVIWMVTMIIINRKQRKALAKEREKTHEEERQNKIMAQLKAQLEVQVAERTAELTSQKEALQQTLTELKATQSQLIHSEKMASLGALTAGIAHEIQNPLNFVNNFSEVNKELLVEMKGEIDKGNMDEVKAIANDVIANEEKISHHGKRAGSIIKGMLQHSRTSTGKKELTDINDLADEYLRLSYHGLRAKDKSFNATMHTDFDARLSTVLGRISIVSEDMGRVLLNLINNAFYAVTEKMKSAGSAPSGGVGYEPTVSVSTKLIIPPLSGKGHRRVEIKVRDNGNGVPQKVLDKIFQPFFTTKPTGQGTGLGLSLSYDIVKAHGGEIKVESKEGEGAEFIIVLPFDKRNPGEA